MFKESFKLIQKTLLKKSPEILLGISIVGSISSVCTAIKVTPQAEYLIHQELERISKEKNIDISEINLKWTDYIKICWKVYIVTGLLLSTSIIATVLSNYIKSKRAGATATALAITQETLKIYQDKVIEEFGKKKEEKIRDEVAKEKLKKDVKSPIVLTGKGDYLCYDAFSGRYFRSTIDNVKRAENELNAIINRDIYASVNDFYDLLGLKPINAGDSLGWNGKLINLNISAQMSDKDNGSEEPCMVIDFNNCEPFENFNKLY